MREPRIYAVAIVLYLLIGAAWHGQCGIVAQGLGFELRGPVTFAGYVGGEPVWAIGKRLRIVATDPTLHRRFRELEDQWILISVERTRTK